MQEPNRNPTKSTLSPARARLVELMQRKNFCTFLDLSVSDGQPVLDPPPRLIREIKPGSENGPRPELRLGDYALKAQVVGMFDLMDAMGTGVIKTLEVKHGLPFRMTIEEDAA